MGGNGPHSGARNSSFGLATLRRDGYAAVRASATTSDPSPPLNPVAEHAGILSLAPIGWTQPGSRPSAHAAPDPVQVHGSGTLVTAKLKVTAPRLTVTADFSGSPQTGSEPPSPPCSLRRPPSHRPSTQLQHSPQAAACRLVSLPRRRTRRWACSPTSRYRSPRMRPTHPSTSRAAPPSRPSWDRRWSSWCAPRSPQHSPFTHTRTRTRTLTLSALLGSGAYAPG